MSGPGAGGGRHTGPVTPPPAGRSGTRGVVRLLNTAGGGVLCLAGEVDRAAVDSFVRRYGREPARVAGIDAGSVTSLSAPALELLVGHLDAARLAGRPITFCHSAEVARLLGAAADLGTP